MRPPLILLSLLLAVSFVILGCEKKAEGPPAPEPMTAPAKAEEPAKEEPKTAEVKYDEVAEKILTATIEAHGGLDKLKAASSRIVEGQGVYWGQKDVFKATYVCGKGWRDDSQLEGGGTRVFTKDSCFSQYGPVVIPCSKMKKETARKEAIIAQAEDLWPLRQTGWELEAGKLEIKGKTYDTLTAKTKGVDTSETLIFDPDTHLLVGFKAQVSRKGESGELMGWFSDFKEFCGVQMSTKYSYRFKGKEYSKGVMEKAECTQVNESIFEPPDQVADGTVEEKQTQAQTVACTTLKGPYSGIPVAIDKLHKFTKKQKLTEAGAPLAVYRKGPPKVKKPKKFVTEICFPVAVKAPKRPKKKGKFVIKGMKPRKVLAAYGVGPYETKSPELMKLLMQEAKKRKLKPAGPMCQISFMDPKETAAEELVSEMQIPIKGVKNAKKKRK